LRREEHTGGMLRNLIGKRESEEALLGLG
jgi:hypothetical protein